MIAACSLFGLLVLAAAVATALTVRGDGCGRHRGPDRVPDVGGLPWAPYRDVTGARWPW